MSDPLDIYEEAFTPAPGQVRGAEQPAPSDWEVFAASLRLSMDQKDIVQADRLANQYLDLADQLVKLGEKREGLWRTTATSPDVMAYSMGGASPLTTTLDRDLVWEAIQRQRRRDPKAFASLPATRAEFDRNVLRRDGGRDNDQAIVARSEGVTGLFSMFAGGVVGEMTDPMNIILLPVGGAGKTVGARILSEGLVGALGEAVLIPQQFRTVKALGEEMTFADAAANIAFGFGAGATFQGSFEVIGAGLRKLAKPGIEQRIARALSEADPNDDPLQVVSDVIAAEDPELAAALIAGQRGNLTPEEQGALTELQRQAEIDAANPYAPIGDGRVQFEDELTRSLDNLIARAGQTQAMAMPPEIPAPPAPAAVRAISASEMVNGRPVALNMARYLARNRRAESSGNDAADAETSSAFGRYQFLRETWLEFYRKTFGETGESPAAILRKRADGDVQDRVMETFTRANLARLERAGFAATEGNAYLAHFLGVEDALKVLRASPDAPLPGLVNGASIAANRAVFDKVGSASELIAWAHRKMGGGGASVPAGGGRVSAQGEVSQGAVLREEAARLQREAAEIQGLGPIQFDRFDPDDIDVDAQLMQFKAGGDEFGVTERLRDVKQWNPFFAGRVMVWEALDGRRLIADGHQRLGLAKRIKAQGDGQQPMLDAFILREADGWDAETVHTWAALKNIAEGTGTAVDASKVLRGVPREVWQQFLPPRSALVRDAEGLVRLGDDAFGMVVNEIVDPSQAALVGRLVDDPGEQKALLDLLLRTSPRTIGEADGVIRQALAAGFAREVQEDMFGTLDVTSSLFLERARVLDRGLAELKKMRQAFGSAARNADTLEAAGNRIDREASAREVEDNARAVEIVRRSAWSAGPVKDALDAGAARLAAGDRPADVIRDFVAAVRGLDLDDLARLAGSGEGAGGRGGADAAGRSGEGGNADAGLRAIDGDPPEPRLTTPEGDPVDPVDGAWPSREDMEQAGQEAFDLGPAASVQKFDEPAGAGQKIQLESVEHDLRQVADREQQAVDEAASRAKLIEDAPEALKIEVDQIRAAAEPRQQALAQLGEELGDLGEFINPGIKGRERMIEKVVREGYGSASELKDVVRGAFVVDTLDGGEAVARLLNERFPGSRDKGWERLPQSGYFDRKLILEMGDGVRAEIQILPRAIWKAKKTEGNRLYQQARSTNDIALQQQLNGRQRELYDQALAGTDFAGIASGSAPGNASMKAAGSRGAPSNSALTNSAGTSRQDPSLNSQDAPDARSMATGRSSTSNSSNVMGAPDGEYTPGLPDLQASLGDDLVGTLFDIDGEQRLLGDILSEADADRAAIAAARSCLL